MMKFSTRNRFGLALGFILALTAQTSQAGILEIDLTVGTDTVQILQGGFFDTGANADTITVNTALLNSTLLALGHGNLTFSALSANTNNPGDPSGATLVQTGTASVTSGTVSFSVLAFQNDFVVPAGSDGLLSSSLGGTYTKTSTGDGTSFTSYYDPTNSVTGNTLPPAIASSTVSSPAPNTNTNAPYAAQAPDAPLGIVAPGYALVNKLDVTLSGSTSKTGTNQFTGSTVLFATAIPEPASVVMMMSALPIALGFVRRYRRGVKTVG